MQTFVNFTLLFSVYSLIGWLCESIYCSIPQGRWINRGFLSGPFCPVYGFGALLILTALSPLLGMFQFPWELVLLFFAGILLTSTLEYLTSVLLERVFHTSWWDYSKHRFQIHGRVCLTNSLLFGLMSVLMLEFLHPLVLSLLEKIPFMLAAPAAGGLFVYFVLDGTVTTVGILRMNGKLAQMQQILDEIAERTAAVAETNLTNLEQSLDELRDKAGDLKSETLQSLRQTLEELRAKADDSRAAEGLERLRNSIQELLNDENQVRLRFLQDKQKYLEEENSPVRRRIIEAFPHMRSIQSPESLQRLRQTISAARERARTVRRK
jgi:uncharacterized membrane protein